MMLRPLSEREKQLFVATSACIFIYLSFTLLIKPLRAQRGVLDGRIEDAQKQLNKNLKVMQKADMLSRAYGDYSEKFKQSQSSEQVMSSMLAEIEAVAQQYNLQILEIKPRTVSQKNLFNEFSVTLTINSQFADILHFLHSLQGKEHFFSVNELQIDKDPNQGSTKMTTRLVLSKTFVR